MAVSGRVTWERGDRQPTDAKGWGRGTLEPEISGGSSKSVPQLESGTFLAPRTTSVFADLAGWRGSDTGQEGPEDKLRYGGARVTR